MSDFSGLVSSTCALASAVASAAIDELHHCIAQLRVRGHKIEADGSGFRTPRPNAVTDRLLGIFRYQALQLGLGLLMVEMRLVGLREDRGELRPSIGRSHIDNTHGFKPRFWRLDPKQLGLFAALDTAPEVALRSDDEMLIQRIGMGEDLDPLPSSGDH